LLPARCSSPTLSTASGRSCRHDDEASCPLSAMSRQSKLPSTVTPGLLNVLSSSPALSRQRMRWWPEVQLIFAESPVWRTAQCVEKRNVHLSGQWPPPRHTGRQRPNGVAQLRWSRAKAAAPCRWLPSKLGRGTAIRSCERRGHVCPLCALRAAAADVLCRFECSEAFCLRFSRKKISL
jgi:hypothetical protein